MRPTRLFLSLALALLMAVTGLATGMARGAMAADGVLCGDGPVRVVLAFDGLPLFDAAGNPVEAADHPCPDCVIGALALAPDAMAPTPLVGGARALSLSTYSGLSPALWRLGGHGRSPPSAA
jgi:hypothetical protein